MRTALLLALALLVGCAQQGGPTVSQGVALCFQTVTTANKTASAALTAGQITTKQACTASEWGKLARVGCDQALQHWLEGDPQTAQQHLHAATLALDGISREAQVRADWSCKRNEPNEPES